MALASFSIDLGVIGIQSVIDKYSLSTDERLSIWKINGPLYRRGGVAFRMLGGVVLVVIFHAYGQTSEFMVSTTH
jgi:hypothetical protein